MPEARGAVIGFGDIHTRAHLYRSIIEGVAYALRDAADKVEKVSGTKIERIMISGGGAQTDSICQITADVFNKPVLRGETYEGCGLGAAIIGFCGAGYYSSFDDAVATWFTTKPASNQIHRLQEHMTSYISVYTRKCIRASSRSMRKCARLPDIPKARKR